MNEILLICKKLNINFKEVIRLAETKWNFLKFNPGLVGGHCLPVDPYYLSSAALKNKFKTLVTLSGRKINETMFNFVIDELKQFLKKKKKTIKSSNILIIGLSYKAGIADMRNSINFKIFNYLFKNKVNVQGFDPYVEESIKTKYQLIEKINKKNNYSVILFLSKHNNSIKSIKN